MPVDNKSVLFCINTPAQAFTWRYVIKNLVRSGHRVKILARDYQNTVEILSGTGAPLHVFRSVTSRYLRPLALLVHVCHGLHSCRDYKPDLVAGFGCDAAVNAALLRRPCFIFTDTEITPLQLMVTKALASVILTPSCFNRELGGKHRRIESYKELAYLHPSCFKPDPEIYRELGLEPGEKFVVLRFNVFDAMHDIGYHGFTHDDRMRLVREISRYARVFVSGEGVLESEYRQYRLPINKSRVHHALYYAHLVVSEGATMTTEAAVLGTPAILSVPFGGKAGMGNFNELERKYGLAYSIPDPDRVIRKAVELLSRPELKAECAEKRHRLLCDKLDLTGYLTECIAGFPGDFERIPGYKQPHPEVPLQAALTAKNGLKLCFIADGTSVHTRDWLNHYASQGHEVHLVCWKLSPGLRPDVHVHLMKHPFKGKSKITEYLNFPSWCRQAKKLVNRIQPDVLDGHFVSVYGFMAAVTGYRPLVVTAWGSDVLIFPRRNPFFRFTAGYAMRRADAVVCTAPVVKKAIEAMGVPSQKVHVVVLGGVDRQKFQPAKKDAFLLAGLGISEDERVIISVRAFKPLYDLITLVKAAPLILASRPSTRFLLAGSGRQEAYLRNRAAELGVAANFIFTGWIEHEDLPGYLASSDIYVSTSLSDGASNGLFEAMASGLAPVCCDIPANSDWIEEWQNGVLFAPRDYIDLAQKVLMLLEDDNLREAFSRRNRGIIKSKVDTETEMGKMEVIYKTLLSAGQGEGINLLREAVDRR